MKKLAKVYINTIPIRRFPSGMSVGTLLFLNFLILCASASVFWFAWHISHSPAVKAEQARQLQAQKDAEAEIAKRKMEDDNQRAFATGERQELLRIIADTTNTLNYAMTALDDVRRNQTELQTNELGQRIAQFPNLVQKFANAFHGAEFLPLPDEFTQRLETSLQRSSDLTQSLGSEAQPTSELYDSVLDSYHWAAKELKDATRVQNYLNQLLRDINAKPYIEAMPTNSMDLGHTINQVSEATGLWPGHQGSKSLDSYIPAAVPDYTYLYSVFADTRRPKREKAQDPHVRGALAPYLSPGYFVPGRVGTPYTDVNVSERHPMSFSRLKRLGAFDPGRNNLEFFIGVAMNPQNDRPHLKKGFESYRWADDPDLYSEARVMQFLLMQLGPTYVDLQLMDP